MIFDNDALLDFRGNLFGENPMGSLFGYDAGEVVITGRVPGALYVGDISEGQTVLEHVLPYEFSTNLVLDGAGSIDEAALTGAVEPSGDGGDPVPANDNPPSASLPQAHAKGEEPLALIVTGDHGAADLQLTVDMPTEVHPVGPLTFDASVLDGTPAESAAEPAPLLMGSSAYQSLSFLIIDTPFAVGDNHLPQTLRPLLNELLGLTFLDQDEGQTFVLPARGWVLS